MKKIKHILFICVAAALAFSACGDEGPNGQDNGAPDVIVSDVPADIRADTGQVVGDVTVGDSNVVDITGIDTNMPDVVVSEQEKQSYQRHAELVAESVDMSYDDLAGAWFDRGPFLESMPFDASTADFMPEITDGYKLDDDALAVLAKNGFVVLDDGSSMTHARLYQDIYYKDLPVFISADSILYAVHKSYDEMLKQMEEYSLIPALGKILDGTVAGLETVCDGYSGAVADACGDIDLYLTVARTLLTGETVAPKYPANVAARDEILAGVESLQPAGIQMFGRPYPCGLCSYDFSQFKPRGHYVDSEELQRYFKAMIWLGRTPMNLTLFDRDLLASVVLEKSLQAGLKMDLWEKLDHAIVVFVGKSDNLTPAGFADIIDELAIDIDLATLPQRAEAVRKTLAEHGVPGSRILSQIMMMDVMSDEPTPVPAEFQLFGQRFVIDSYVFSNVVYDRITWQGSKPERLMPDPLDVAFVLGFDQAVPFLEDEIKTWNYAGNLNVLRTMVEEYDAGFWTESMYNAWLAGLRALAVDQSGESFPAAVRTAAWGHRAMQTGLASWAELRHDTILYVKQSYTGETCEYPDGYVEPNPGFFLAVKTFAEQSKSMMKTIAFGENDWSVNRAEYWFNNLAVAADMLAGIAQAQIDGTPRTADQTEFIKTTVVDDAMCGGPGFSGWYASLFFDAQTDTFNFKPTVADVHTDPNSTEVLHVATGGANPMVVIIQLEGGPRAFVGPVSSYYQFREPGFVRLTDAEWLTRYSALEGYVPRPSWTESFVSKVDHSGYKTYCEE